jgi:hypothetical protein
MLRFPPFLGAWALAGALAPAAMAAGPASFLITTSDRPATLAVDPHQPGNSIVTVLPKDGIDPLGRLNDRKNANYTGQERIPLAAGGTYEVVLSAYRSRGLARMVLTCAGRSARFALAVAPGTGTARLGGRVLGAPGLLTVTGDGDACTVSAGPAEPAATAPAPVPAGATPAP